MGGLPFRLPEALRNDAAFTDFPLMRNADRPLHLYLKSL
jgi:hypothetical protein